MTAEGEVGNTAAIHYLLKCASASSAAISGLRAGHAQLRHAGQPGSSCLSPLRQLLLLPLRQLLLLLHVQYVTHVVHTCLTRVVFFSFTARFLTSASIWTYIFTCFCVFSHNYIYRSSAHFDVVIAIYLTILLIFYRAITW